jgi:hypothetical protein
MCPGFPQHIVKEIGQFAPEKLQVKGARSPAMRSLDSCMMLVSTVHERPSAEAGSDLLEKHIDRLIRGFVSEKERKPERTRSR